MLIDVLLVIEIDLRNPNVRVVLKSCAEVVDDDRCENCLPCAGNPWTEESLLARRYPSLILCRIQKPLASSRLSPLEEVTMLRTVVDWREPVKYLKVFFSV